MATRIHYTNTANGHTACDDTETTHGTHNRADVTCDDCKELIEEDPRVATRDDLDSPFDFDRDE